MPIARARGDRRAARALSHDVAPILQDPSRYELQGTRTMNLAHTLTQAALKWPNKTALVFEGRRWTYAQWNRLVNKSAHAFRASGIGKGDRVAILTYNLPEQVTAFYALMKIGADSGADKLPPGRERGEVHP